MLLLNLNLLATAPGGVARLRELILTLAVQGKLVPQDPQDEPASALLKKIRVEKDRLIAAGTIKRDKPLAGITEEEKPFGLPRGWEWVHLTTLAEQITKGTTPTTFGHSYTNEGVNFVKIENLDRGRLNLAQMTDFISPETHEIMSRSQLSAGDVLFSIAGTIGKTAVVLEADLPANTNQALAIIKGAAKHVNQRFLLLALDSFVSNKVKDRARGGAMNNISLGDLSELLMTIPPLAEQSRIVTRVKELMRLCDALEAKGQLEAAQHTQLVSTLLGALTQSDTPEQLAENWQRVASHFDLLLDRPQAVDALEQTILQLAVRGLLVPQDPQDEPASVLLQKIRQEKDRLIAQGQIKRDKPLPPMAEDEPPFDLPPGWEWSSLAEIGVINPRNHVGDDMAASFVQMSSIPARLGEEHRSEERLWCEIKSGFTHFAEGDVGVAKITPCFENGKSTVFRNLSNGVGAGTTELHIFRPLLALQPDYVLLFLKTPAFLKGGERVMTGSAGQKRLPRAFFENTPFPLPPLVEQSRIVARVAALRQLCADLRARLSASQSTQAQLAEALVDSVGSGEPVVA